jgi:hypothetical protein
MSTWHSQDWPEAFRKAGEEVAIRVFFPILIDFLRQAMHSCI